MKRGVRMSNDMTIWDSPNGVTLPPNQNLTVIINDIAVQLKPQEKQNIVTALNNELFDMSSEYIWNRTISILKEKVLTLGEDFVLEMLDRTIDEDISNVSSNEFINLASELGFINTIARDKLLHANDLINYYQSRTAEESMSSYDMQTIVIPCIQYVVGLDANDFSFEFNNFREVLKDKQLDTSSELYQTLLISPYFYKRTTVKTLINLMNTSDGGELERVLANMVLIFSGIWEGLISDDRYTIGVTFAEAKNNKQTHLINSLEQVLTSNGGFDYVPEDLRSQAFIKVANKLRDAHYSFDNFYKEPIPAKNLSTMGIIPRPALSYCISAVLISTLGNFYGVSQNAQPYNNKTLKDISPNRWKYYFTESFLKDKDVLFKLSNYSKTITKWIDFISSNSETFQNLDVVHPDISKLLKYSLDKKASSVQRVAKKLYQTIDKN